MEQLVWWIFLGEIANEKAQLHELCRSRQKKPQILKIQAVNYVIERPEITL
jgi:hypothetical protein